MYNIYPHGKIDFALVHNRRIKIEISANHFFETTTKQVEDDDGNNNDNNNNRGVYVRYIRAVIECIDLVLCFHNVPAFLLMELVPIHDIYTLGTLLYTLLQTLTQIRFKRAIICPPCKCGAYMSIYSTYPISYGMELDYLCLFPIPGLGRYHQATNIKSNGTSIAIRGKLVR